MQSTSWWMDILRSLFFEIDKIVYGLIDLLYNLFVFISDLTIFSNADYLKFTNKIYLILGIVMLFKIAFSLISLFANPDDVMDSGKGVPGIVKRIVISLIIITFIPTLFQTAYRIQSIIIKDNIIGNFFLGNIASGGKPSENPTEDDQKIAMDIQKNAGKTISFSILSAFYYPESFLIVPEEKSEVDKNKQYKFNPDVDLSSKACSSSSGTELCDGHLYYNIVEDTKSMSDYGKFLVKEDRKQDVYTMHYMFIISTIAGLASAWIFLGFCFDVAIRSVKLAVLQLIAPIPVFSYIDPKKGEGIFKSWYTTCLSTYISLFMRIIIIFLVVYICHILGSAGLQQFDATGTPIPITTKGGMEVLGTAMMMFGLLMFAKDAPKLFSEMFGIKTESSFGTTIAKAGLGATGLAAGVGLSKYAGSKYRRGFEKASNRRGISSLKDRLTNENLSDSEREKINSEMADLQNRNKWSTGLKENFNATRYGVTSGALTGWKAKGVSKAGLKSGIMSAHNTEKIRGKGLSFRSQVAEKMSTYAGVPNKYGEFGKYKEEKDSYMNELHDVKRIEDRFSENYVDQMTKASNQFGIDPEKAYEFDRLLKEKIDKNDAAAMVAHENQIEELKLKIAEDYAGRLGSEGTESYADAIKEASTSLDSISNLQKTVSLYNDKQQKIETNIKNVDAKINSSGEGKK